ncbi:MAG TPA: putative leader peptide [Actinocrinis sp.]|nr:putative leader peptide [Actinocrinis sp.]
MSTLVRPIPTSPPRFSGILVARRHIDLQRVNSALCS